MHTDAINSCAYTATVYVYKIVLDILTVVPSQIRSQMFARSGPLLQIRSHIYILYYTVS